MTEADVLNAARKQAEKLGCMFLRLSFRAGARSGWPDLLIFGSGARILFMECKAPGKKASKLQSHIMGKLNELGFETVVCDTIDSAREAITSVMARHARPSGGG